MIVGTVFLTQTHSLTNAAIELEDLGDDDIALGPHLEW